MEVSKHSQRNNSETITNEHDKQISYKLYQERDKKETKNY